MKKTILSITLLLTLTFCGNSGVYAQTQKGIDIDGEAAGDNSGRSVSMPDANTIAVGAFQNDGNGSDAGHVRIYTWNGSTWTQKGTDIDGEASGDWSGYSVSMPNANTVAIGATNNDGNGFAAGHVRIYTWNGSAWTQQGTDIDGEAAFDYFGYSVSMPDVNTVVIGAPFNDGNGNNAGHVRVYHQIPVGIPVVSVLAEIGLFPNPTTGLIYFQEQSNIKLANITGQVIIDQTNVSSLNLVNQPSGIYFITFSDNDGQIIQRSKIVKE